MWLGALVAALLAGCASVPPPTALMAQASQQLDAARQAHAADYAPVDIGFAQKRYAEAQMAVGMKKYDLATDLANESLADGRLAQVRAELAVARRQVQAQRAENDRARTQLLEAPAAAASAPGNANAGLPGQVILPQPKMAPPLPAAPASATPAPAASAATHDPEAAR